MQLTGHNDNMNTWTSASYGGGWLAFFAGLTFENWVALVGALILVLTFLVTSWKHIREDARHAADDRRKQELHELRKKLLQEGKEV